jgi:HD superfamily phosphohydrolase
VAKLADAPDLGLRNHRFHDIALRFKSQRRYEGKTAVLTKLQNPANGEQKGGHSSTNSSTDAPDRRQVRSIFYCRRQQTNCSSTVSLSSSSREPAGGLGNRLRHLLDVFRVSRLIFSDYNESRQFCRALRMGGCHSANGMDLLSKISRMFGGVPNNHRVREVKSPSIRSGGKVFRDPVHGLIRVEQGNDFVISLINTREFQRLRRIRQLGVSNLTYPGAEHSRFAHSLGVFNFAQRMLRMLNRRYKGSKDVVDAIAENNDTVKAAALLHDIGHGPFSHMIERAFPATANHELRTIELIRDRGSIPEILERGGLDPAGVADIVLKTSRLRFLVDIISSQLDADRMDYILRDALNTGVKYGAYDSEWILNSLCLGLEPGTGFDIRNLRLCLEKRRGLYSAEQVVMSRMHMSYQVYFHRETRRWEAHMLCLLGLASALVSEGRLPPGAPAPVESFLSASGRLNDDDWWGLDESTMEAALHSWLRRKNDVPELAELCRSFLEREKVFKCAELGQLSTAASMRLEKEMSSCGRESIDWLLDDPKFTSYKDFDSGFRTSERRPDAEEASTSAILVASGNLSEPAEPAEMASRVLEALGENPPGTRMSLCRLYYHVNIADNVRKNIMDIAISTE